MKTAMLTIFLSVFCFFFYAQKATISIGPITDYPDTRDLYKITGGYLSYKVDRRKVKMATLFSSINFSKLQFDITLIRYDESMKVIKENVGIQDQILVSHGGLQIIEMGPGPGFRISPLILPKDYKSSFESHILLGFTGFQRNSTDVAKGHVENIKVGKSVSQLKDIHEIAKEGLLLL